MKILDFFGKGVNYFERFSVLSPGVAKEHAPVLGMTVQGACPANEIPTVLCKTLYKVFTKEL